MKIMIEQYVINQCPATFCQPRGAWPELFAVVGGQVPDLRELFLRKAWENSAALGVQQGDQLSFSAIPLRSSYSDKPVSMIHGKSLIMCGLESRHVGLGLLK